MKNDTVQISDRFKKREFVVNIDEESQYPQPILCQLTQDRCSKLDNFEAGDKVKVDFYLKGREWQSPQGDVKYFISVDAWTIEKLSGEAPVENKQAPSEIPLPSGPNPFENNDKDMDSKADDDLPF